LVQRPQRFRQIAIQFKELLQEPLWNFIWGKIHAVQSAEEREEVEPGNFQARTEVAGNGQRVARGHAPSIAHGCVTRKIPVLASPMEVG
jgi:hypothetical protein